MHAEATVMETVLTYCSTTLHATLSHYIASRTEIFSSSPAFNERSTFFLSDDIGVNFIEWMMPRLKGGSLAVVFGGKNLMVMLEMDYAWDGQNSCQQ